MRTKFTLSKALPALAVLALVAYGCDEIDFLNPDSQKPKVPSAAVTSISPESASLGDIVRVECAEPVFDNERTRVEIGGQSALILTRVSATEADVATPNLPPGRVDVVIVEDGKIAGPAVALEVLPPDVVEASLTMDATGIALVSQTPVGGGLRRSADEGGRRLHYEVYSNAGRVVFSDVLVHPTMGRREVYDGPSQGGTILHREMDRTRASFWLKVPYASDGVSVKLYDVPDGANLKTAAGLAARTYLTTVQVRG